MKRDTASGAAGVMFGAYTTCSGGVSALLRALLVANQVLLAALDEHRVFVDALGAAVDGTMDSQEDQ